jgi:hypothetical protein
VATQPPEPIGGTRIDHLYRYANLYEMLERRKAEKVVDALTEVMPGRPTIAEHRHPFDNVRNPSAKDTVDPPVQAGRLDNPVGRAAGGHLLHERRPARHGADRPVPRQNCSHMV